MIRLLFVVTICLSSCGRNHVKHRDLDLTKCDLKTMNARKKINPKIKYIKTADAIAIIDADRNCIRSIESVNDHNRKAAIINRPDSFYEDMQEFFMGFGIGSIITLIALAF